MHKSDSLILRDIVLVGGGHSHVEVLRVFGMKPCPGVRITLICTEIQTPYSGMLPGYIAGHYRHDEIHIDLGRLCMFAGARLFKDEVIGIDRANQKVICKNRPPVTYDALSINIGSTPEVQMVPGALENAVPVKPIPKFNQHWLNLLERVKTHSKKFTIAVVGGGAGGVELALAMQLRLYNELMAQGRNPDALEFHLFTANSQILPTHNPRVQNRFVKALALRRIVLHQNAEITQVDKHTLHTRQGTRVHADEIMWVTRAEGAAWLKNTGLELNKHGFINVKPTLQTTSDPAIFAAGDIANLTNMSLEKAGVLAVRMGKPLAKNLRLFVQGAKLQEYRPQKTWLALISTGNKYAVASKASFCFSGSWVWHWKNWIDRRFMARFSEFPNRPPSIALPYNDPLNLALTQEENLQVMSTMSMRCGGCAAKIGGHILARTLGKLSPVKRDDVLVGLDAPDDAAIVKVPPGKAMVHTVDFFRAFIDDPYIFGKVAANHALSDIFAMGGQAQSATAIITVPPGLELKVEDVLFQMMSGAIEILNHAGCTLVGGHTGEGRELALGFAINGLVNANLEGVMMKSGMRPGDAIILTKPIGTGTLFAALPQLKTKGLWIDTALELMQQSNRVSAQCLCEFGATACTDLTGFGLLGHLLDMAQASKVGAELNLNALPLLDGALDMMKAGVVSSLQAANMSLHHAIDNQEKYINDPRYGLIFDPQTAGGLLATVPCNKVQACIAALKRLGYQHSAIIGQVFQRDQAMNPIVLRKH